MESKQRLAGPEGMAFSQTMASLIHTDMHWSHRAVQTPDRQLWASNWKTPAHPQKGANKKLAILLVVERKKKYSDSIR